jgi:glycosyltransferase involved in cell wall biosynthesis
MHNFKGKHILIIVENLPLPFDVRVWQEANTLKSCGAEISVICPRMKGYTKKYEELNGVHIYRHSLPIEGKHACGYFIEYSVALFWEFILSLKIFIKKRFHVIHGCNPPDLIFLIALFFKLFGVKYIFDHHDINPELFYAKFGRKGLFYKIMLLLERLTFKTAGYSIATNNSYREIAIKRDKMDPDKVEVVRSGPNPTRLKILPGNNKYKKGRKYLVGYIGVIGKQEGLDLLLKIIQIIIAKRNDVQFTIIGEGTELQQIKNQCRYMGLSEYVDFYGRVSDKLLLDILNTSDICVNPDRPTEMNNLSTMNKIMEYMALKKPIVQFDLKEGRYSAQEASLYAKNLDIQDFANKIIYLLDNEQKRKEMGEFGYQRIRNELSWDIESKKLISFYGKILGKR